MRRDAGVPSSGELPTRIRTEYTRFATFPSHGGRGMRERVRVRVVQEPKPKTKNPIFTPVHFKRLGQALRVSDRSKLFGIESIHERA